jgi:hypothetical protein
MAGQIVLHPNDAIPINAERRRALIRQYLFEAFPQGQMHFPKHNLYNQTL